jgi:c-di-GMP-binding flagellar brake protein YcgR
MTPQPATTSGPSVDRIVTVHVPGVEDVPAKVLRRGEGFTELKLQARTQSPLQSLQHTQVFIEFVTDDGMWRMLGTLTLRAAADGEALRFEHTGRTQLLQRRAHVRTDLIAAVIFTPEGGPPRKAMTLNVSGGGLLVRGLAGVGVEEEMAFDLRLDLLPARIQGRCRVVRQTADGLHGVQFTDIDEGDRDKVVRFAYQRENAARRARFGY